MFGWSIISHYFLSVSIYSHNRNPTTMRDGESQDLEDWSSQKSVALGSGKICADRAL